MSHVYVPIFFSAGGVNALAGVLSNKESAIAITKAHKIVEYFATFLPKTYSCTVVGSKFHH